MAKLQNKENHYLKCFITDVSEELEIKQPIFSPIPFQCLTFYSFAASLPYMCFVDSPIYLL